MRIQCLLTLSCSLLLGFLLLATPAFAAENLQEFFTPAHGTVIMPIGDKYLLDLDASDQIAQGDLVSVYYEGDKIIHPTTGDILGTVHSYGPILQITEIKSGYSYAKLVTGDKVVSRGDKVSRFENIPVYFLDESGQNAALFSQLKRDLPQLNWGGYLTATDAKFFHQRPLLVIKPMNNNLAVIDQNNQVIQVFSALGRSTQATPDTGKTPSGSILAAAPAATSPLTAPQLSALPPQKGGLFAPPPPTATEKAGGMTRGSRFDSQIYAIAIADLSGSGKQQAVIALDGKLVLGNFVKNEFQATSHLDLNPHQKILKLTPFDCDADGQLEIYASGVNDQQVDSLVLQVAKGQLVIHSRQTLLFNLLKSANGETVLVGQSKDDLLSYPASASRIRLAGDKLKTSPYNLKPLWQIYGTTTLRLNEEKNLQVMLTKNDHLKVLRPDNSEAWQSDSYYGGSEAALLYLPQDSLQDNNPRPFFLKAKMVTTERNSIMTTKHQGSRLLSDSPDFGSGQIVELYWNGFSLEETGATADLGGYVPDFELVDIDGDGDQDLVAAVVYSKNGLFSDPVSGIVVIPNDR